MPKFITNEVWAVLNGNETRVAVLPFRQRADAEMWAKSLPKGYVLRGSADCEPQGVSCLAVSDGSRSWQLVKGQTEPTRADEPKPVPVPTTFAVHDAVNERLVRATFGGTGGNPALTFPTMKHAEDHAKELNMFGGYGGYVSLRFVAVMVPVSETLNVPDVVPMQPARFSTFATG